MKKRKMATLRLTNLVLATFFVFQSLRNSSLAHADHHVHGEIVDSSGTRLMVERHYIAPQKEQIRGAVRKRKGFGGRKMMKGNDHEYAQMSTFQKAKDSASKQPRTKTLNVAGKDDASQSAIDAEIKTFMYKDYHGMKKRKRKPPVNNGMPND